MRPEKYQGFNGIRNRALRDTGAMLDQLSYEATHWESMYFTFPSFPKNFHFYEDGVRSRKTYQIGKGRFYSYALTITGTPEDTKLKIL